jgi:hypothetical protein
MARQLIQLDGRPLLALTFDGDTETWVFAFSGAVVLSVRTPWRVRTAAEVIVGWRDDGQKFGRETPKDAAAEVKAAVEGSTVASADARDGTGDLAVHFANGTVLEVFNDSSGYEGWQLDHPGGSTIALGGGQVVGV